jgi:hypothetical protein
VRIRMHPARWLHSAPKHLRDAQCVSWIPLGATTAFHTQELWSAYPPDIRQWISQHGGLSGQMIWLQAPAIYRYFRKC